MPRPPNFGTSSELRLLRALIDRPEGSSQSEVDVEKAIESGLARLMSLEGRLREQGSRAIGRPSSEELRKDQGLVEEIRDLRAAVVELRARMNPGGSAPLAQGCVFAPQTLKLD